MLLSGETDASAPVSDRVHRLAESIGQDIVYGITCAKVKPPKQILLPYAAKSLTGCVELIRILNRSGHGVSYSQIEEIDTALCLHKLSLSEESVALPECIQPNVQVTLAFDNIDRLEETLSGGGTSHRVNEIVVQPKVFGPQRLKGVLNEPKQKYRTIKAVPPQLPIYNAGVRVGPPSRGYIEVDDRELKQELHKKTLLWLITRLHCAANQTVSSWTGFNIQVRDEVEVTSDVIGYLPTINAPATQLSTVHEVLCQSQKIRTLLAFESIVVVFDQALYAKATEIIWKQKETFSEIIPRLGVFHTVCTLLSVLGKRFQDAGLRDLCVESGVIADDSVEGVLDGRRYNRAVRFHKLLYEALQRLVWKGFDGWMASKKISPEITQMINEFSQDICQKTFTETLHNPVFISVADHFQQYQNHLRQHGGDLASFWMSYLDIVDNMLNLLRSSREGNWSLHLSAIHDMIPWCFAYDKQNYARYLFSYYAEMTNLGDEHPHVLAFLKSGGFSVQIGSENPFGRIPVDQTIEETVNKGTQTPGGTKGFSLKPGAISRHYLTVEYRSSFLRLLRDAMGTGSSSFKHPDLSQSRIKRDEKDVVAFVEMLDSNWTNPFCGHSDLTSLSTGIAAPGDIATDLLEAKNNGAAAYKLFREERLGKEVKMGFFEPLPKQRLKTFADIVVKKTYQTKGREVIMKADRNLFAKMILIGQTRKLDMKDVLSHRLGPIPWALANPEGTMRKTNKAALAKRLKKDLSTAESIPENSACIIDGMALVQKILANSNHMSFAEVSKVILSAALREGTTCGRIDMVFDVYRDESIKNAERVHRGSQSGISFRTLAPGHRVKQWKNFLRNQENKTRLIQFLVTHWSEDEQRSRLAGKQFFVTMGETCRRLTADSVSNVEALRCSQEEADTRILLHAKHCAGSGFTAVVIVSEDTDVFIIGMAFSSQLPCSLYMKSGTKTRTEYVDVKKAVDALGLGKCAGLLGLHAFTGCDTVSCFTGKGKVSALRLLTSDRHRNTFKCLGTDWDVSPQLFKSLESLTCSLYSARTVTEHVNELRFNLFCAKKGEAESWQLPPCTSSLRNHCKRATYQCAVWKRGLDAFPEIPSPVGHGWKKEDGDLVIDWGDASPASEAVMELIACNCRKKCLEESCTCLQNNMKCKYICTLQTCSNQKVEDEDEVEFEASDDDDDDDISDDE